MIAAFVAIELVTLHMLDGRAVQINPASVQQLIPASKPRNHLMAPGVECLLRLGGGYVSVRETCSEVQRLLEGNQL